MFYTLASKLVIKGGGKRNFLYVFLVGSVLYVAVHWYLHMEQKRSGFINKIKQYLYYAMAIDLAVAYVLTVMLSSPKTEEEPEPKKKQKKEYTDEEKRAIMARMQEAKRHQMRAQQLAMQRRDAEIRGGPGGPGGPGDPDGLNISGGPSGPGGPGRPNGPNPIDRRPEPESRNLPNAPERENSRRQESDRRRNQNDEDIDTPRPPRNADKKSQRSRRTEDRKSIFSKSESSDTAGTGDCDDVNEKCAVTPRANGVEQRPLSDNRNDDGNDGGGVDNETVEDTEIPMFEN